MKLSLLISILTLFPWNPFTAQTIDYTPELDEITGYVRREYVDSVNIDSLINTMVQEYLSKPETINELFQRLDPHSNYLMEEEYTRLKEDLKGSFYGVGIHFYHHADTVLITHVFEGGPAWKAGMKTGDVIMKVNEMVVSGGGRTVDDIFAALRGAKGSSVSVEVLRKSVPATVLCNVVRDEIHLSSIEAAYMLDNETGYIRFLYVTDQSHTEMQGALQKLKVQGMKQVILDMRRNSGGYLRSAVAIADEFLSGNKLVVYTKGKQSARSFLAEKQGLFERGKMVVLVNNFTASAAEILAGALQDNKRAGIIGTRTYGKGLIQVIYPLSDSLTALKLTTSRYYTPSGRCIQRPYDEGSEAYYDDFRTASINAGVLPQSYSNDDWGIQPDILVSEDTSVVSRIFTAIENHDYIRNIAYMHYADNMAAVSLYNSPEELNDLFEVEDILFEKLKEFIAEEEARRAPEERIHYTAEHLHALRTRIATAFKAHLAFERWGYEGLCRVQNASDEYIRIALEELKED